MHATPIVASQAQLWEQLAAEGEEHGAEVPGLIGEPRVPHEVVRWVALMQRTIAWSFSLTDTGSM